MRYVQVRLEDQEYEALDQCARFGGYRSMQQVARRAIVDFVTAPKAEPSQDFLDLAARFHAGAPEEIREWVEDTMRRFVQIESKAPSRRRKRTG